MSLTVTLKEGKDIIEKCGMGYRMVTGSLAFNNSYPAGGETLDLSKIFPKDLHLVLIEPKGGYFFAYDYANKTVMAYFFEYTAQADGVAIELSNGDLDALTDVRFVAIGK